MENLVRQQVKTLANMFPDYILTKSSHHITIHKDSKRPRHGIRGAKEILQQLNDKGFIYSTYDYNLNTFYIFDNEKMFEADLNQVGVYRLLDGRMFCKHTVYEC